MSRFRFLFPRQTAMAAVALSLALGAPAIAQQVDDEQPAVAPAAKPAKPARRASRTPKKAAPAEGSEKPEENSGAGLTIIGDQESPIGLYITPWKNDYAEHSLDRPARFVDDELVPLDPDVFRRQIEFYDAIGRFRTKQVAPPAPAGAAAPP